MARTYGADLLVGVWSKHLWVLIISDGLETPLSNDLFFSFTSLTVSFLLGCCWLCWVISLVVDEFFKQIFVICALISLISNAQNLQLPPEFHVLNEPRLMPIHKTIAGHKGIMLAQWWDLRLWVVVTVMMGILMHYLSALSCIQYIFIKGAQLKCVSKYYPQWYKLVMTL